MKYRVSPLTCGGCVRRITEALQAIDSGANVRVDLTAGTVEADGAFDAATLVATLAAIGYQALPAQAAAGPGDGHCCGSCHA